MEQPGIVAQSIWGARGPRSQLYRLLGRHSLIHLSMPTEDGEDVHLHARVPGLNMISPGEKVFLSVDPDQVFVFPL